MAATQVENQVSTASSTSTTTSIFKKSSPKGPVESNLSGWKFGNMGTLNIHIHMHYDDQ